MSADIYITANKRSLVAAVNITYNLTPMLRAAGMDWSDFATLPTPALVEKLGTTIATLKADRPRFSELNPPNGWGSYDHLVKSLGEVLEALADPDNGDPKVTTWL